jgi:hypothetical protein
MLTLEDIEAHYARMNIPEGEPHAHLPVDVTNPGTSRPETHGGTGLQSIDQTMSVSISSNAGRTSDGQGQRLDLSPLQGGVNVTELPPLSPRSFNGEFQRKNRRQIDQGTMTSVGVKSPVDVNVSGQNLHRSPLVEVNGTPPAKDFRPGDKKLGGIPVSIAIK